MAVGSSSYQQKIPQSFIPGILEIDSLFKWLKTAPEIHLQAVVTQQIRLQGSCAICGEYPAVLDMIERKEVNVDAILSAEAPLSEGAAWFQRLYRKEPGLIKVVLKP